MGFSPALLVIAALQAQDPWAVIARAESAVVHDSAAEAVAAWRARLDAPDPDWAAYLGIGTVGLRTYDREIALPAFQRLADDAPAPWNVFGLRGIGVLETINTELVRADDTFTRALALHAAGDERLRAELSLFRNRVRTRLRGAAFARAELDALAGGLPDDPYIEALYRCTRGTIAALDGERRTEDLERGMALAAREGHRRLRAQCGTYLAGVLNNMQLVDSALAVFTGVIADARAARDPALEAGARQWRGFMYRIWGYYGLSLEDLTLAVARAEAAGAASPRSWALLNLALLYHSLGEPARGLTYARMARDAFAMQNDRFQAASLMGLEALSLTLAGDPERGLASYRAAIALADSIGFRDLAVNGHLPAVHAAILAGDTAAVRQHVRDMGAAVERYRADNWRASWLYTAAAAARWEGDRDRFARFITRGRALLSGEDFVWQYHFGMRAAELAATAGRVDEAVAEADAAFAGLENMRAGMDQRGLRLLAFQRSDDLSDPDLGFATVIAALARGGRLDDAFRLTERSRAGELLRELLRADAFTDRPAAAGHRTYAVPALADVQAALPDETALVSLVTGVGGEPTTALVIHGDGVAAHLLPPVDSLADPIARLRDLLESGAAADEPARTLGAALLQPLANSALFATVGHLIVVPSGQLFEVPYSALRLADGQPAATRWSVSVVPSAAVALALWGRERQTGPARALVLADAPTGDSLPALPGARREARRVARYADAAVVRRGADAGEAWLKGAPLDSFRLIHAAVHAAADRAGLTAGLLLASGAGEDGLLRPGEVGQLDLAADLVVLSACHSARGDVLRGEGLRGLVAPFLEAGGRAVVATHWRVEDRATMRFVDRMYAALADGEPAAEALRTARLAAISDGEPAAHWAAFALIGDGTVTLPLSHPLRIPWPLLALAAAALATALGILARRTGTRRTD